MTKAILLSLLFNVTTALSVALTGDKSIIDSNFSQNFFKILLNWRFIVAMIMAVLSRFIFIAINSQINKLPAFSDNSTTISVLITATSYIFIIVANVLLLNDKLTPVQIFGSFVIICGVVIVML